MALPRSRSRRLLLEPLDDRLTPAADPLSPALPSALAGVVSPGLATPATDAVGTLAVPAAGPGGKAAVTALATTANPQFAQITDQNRNAPSMTGGWNPALRGIMVMDDGSRWFAAETGTNPAVNTAMVYYRLDPTGWKAVGSVALPAGIQQNMATITNGRFIYAYGISQGRVIEAWFDTTRPRWNLVTGNALIASGQVMPSGAGANYVGAAWHNNTRFVWWSTVGANGAGGTWHYTYNLGGGWNGPFVIGIGGYGSLGYVRTRVDDQGRLRLLGEAHVGLYPAGRFDVMEATLTPGVPVRWTRVLPGIAHSAVDLWPGAGSTNHYLYRTDLLMDTVGYSYGPAGGPQTVTFPALEGRFVQAGDQLALVLAYQHSIEVRLVPLSEAAAGPIDWINVAPITIPLPAALDPPGGVSAIWTSDEGRQPHPSDRLEFAICGGFPTRDNLIYYVTL